MAAEVITGLRLFKSMLDSAKGLKDMNDAAVRNAAVIELQEKILAAQSEQATLVQRIRELEAEVADLKAWETEKQRYHLQAVATGAFAYALKPEAEGSEPPHWICAACYQNGRKSVLQRGHSHGSGEWPFICPTCKSVIYVSQGPGQERPALAKAAGEPCPKCGEKEFRIERSEPDPTFGRLGVSLRHMKCGACGFTEDRQHRA